MQLQALKKGRYTIAACTPSCDECDDPPLERRGLEGRPGCRSTVRALKFGAVGIANTALDVALFSLLTVAVGISAVAANVMSYSAGIGLSFVFNRAWTFHDRPRHRSWSRLALFAIGSIGGLVVSTLVVAGLVRIWGLLPAKAASLIATFAWNYLFANRLVFRR